MFVRARVMLSISALMVFMIGCAVNYVPKPVGVNLAKLRNIDITLHVNIINAQTNSDKFIVGRYMGEILVGDLQTLTGSAVELVKEVFEEERSTISESSSIILKLTVTDAKMRARDFFVSGRALCKISLKVETGDGYSRTYRVIDSGRHGLWACDNTMTKVVSSLLQDKAIIDYLKK
jgi:hypothetical protein